MYVHWSKIRADGYENHPSFRHVLFRNTTNSRLKYIIRRKNELRQSYEREAAIQFFAIFLIIIRLGFE